MRLLKPIVIALLFFSGAALAEASANIEGMPIRHGDTLENVQEAYKTTMVPEAFKTPDDGSRGLPEDQRRLVLFRQERQDR
jgi:hypothetical protein